MTNRPDYIVGTHGLIVRYQTPKAVIDPLERFVAMTERVLIDGDYCIIWKGGKTFRVDDVTITTPARFFWQAMTGERPRAGEPLARTCLTAGCVKHWERR